MNIREELVLRCSKSKRNELEIGKLPRLPKVSQMDPGLDHVWGSVASHMENI